MSFAQGRALTRWIHKTFVLLVHTAMGYVSNAPVRPKGQPVQLDFDKVDTDMQCGNIDPKAYLPAETQHLLSKPDKLFDAHLPLTSRPSVPRFRGSRGQYLQLLAAMVKQDRVRFRCRVRSGVLLSSS